MKSRTTLWSATALIFLCAVVAVGQTPNCNALVTLDEGGFGNGVKLASAASSLIDQGADVHVVFVDTASALLTMERSLEATCPSWTIAGRRKPNLFVVMVAPKQRMKNAFFGAAYSPVFPTEDSVNTLYSRAANPFFKQGDFAGGVAAALLDFSKAVAAYHDQQKHPVQQSTVVQATDMRGLWTVLGWIVGLLALVVAIIMWVRWLGARRAAKEKTALAQTSAQAARAITTRTYQRMDKGATNAPDVSQRFGELSNSVSNDPDTTGLTAVDYERIRQNWIDLRDNIQPTPSSFTTTSHKRQGQGRSHDNRPFSGNYMPAPAPTSSTVVVNNSGNDLLTGVILGEELSRPTQRERYEDPTPPRHERTPDPEPDRSSSSSSGSDSSWGSGSSSGSNSGSDSSFSSDSSPSSDFGGGGSDSSW